MELFNQVFVHAIFTKLIAIKAMTIIINALKPKRIISLLFAKKNYFVVLLPHNMPDFRKYVFIPQTYKGNPPYMSVIYSKF